MAASKRLIVNADDFGRTPGINRGVVDAHVRGVVTSTTLMVAYPAAKEAAASARANPGLGVGLHVALTGGRSVLPRSMIPSLVDAQQALPAKPEGLVGARPEEILLEVRAQLRAFRELMGRSPTHLDSHHHSQRIPAVLEALVTVSWETGLPVRAVSREMRARFSRERIPTNDRFLDSFYQSGASLDNLLRLLSTLNLETTEIMCHPAIVDDELRAGSSYADERNRELGILTQPEVRHAIQAAGIQLIHYGAL